MIYFDNASTSYPKPEEVVNGVNELICNSAGSSMRTANTEKVDIIFKTRELVANILNVKYPTSIVFTANATESLNSIIDGFLSEGDTVVTTAIEHNSVIRPLIRLKHEKGINIKWIKSDEFGYVNPDEVVKQVNETTKLVIMNHASNVTGMVQNIEKVGKALAKYPKVKFLVDAAQTLGHIPFDNEKVNADFISFTGHKGLLGITGVGGYYINPQINIRPLKVGGTGVLSELLVQPAGSPLHYEAGTLNQVGIGSLYYGISHLNKVGIENISTSLLNKTNLLITKLKKLDHVTVYSKPNFVGIVSFNVDEVIPSRLSTFLLEDYDIKTRSGLMCAPFVHEFLGTNPYGCIRASLSIKNTEKDILDFVEAIRKVTQNYNDIRNIRIPNIYSSPSIYNLD